MRVLLDTAVSARLTVFERIEFTIPQIVSLDKLNDKKDLPVLRTALSGCCEVIITGDKQLHKLGGFNNIPIITPQEFWNFEVNKSTK